ncbi:MAG TPA: hypothetical protein VJT32_06905 [bacterium]|nr:hypothetical protein [bacterium]
MTAATPHVRDGRPELRGTFKVVRLGPEPPEGDAPILRYAIVQAREIPANDGNRGELRVDAWLTPWIVPPGADLSLDERRTDWWLIDDRWERVEHMMGQRQTLDPLPVYVAKGKGD